MEQSGTEGIHLGPMRMGELLASALRARIMAGGIADGDSLPKQDEIVAEFGVSPPSVREALRILETEGLITVRRGNRGGATVHAPDLGTAAYAVGLTLQAMQVKVPDLAGAIVTLEPMCAAHCAERTDRRRAVVPALRELLDAGAAVLDDGPAFTRASRDFHAAVVGFEPNVTLRVAVQSLTSLWTVMEEAWADSQTSRGSYPSKTDRARSVQAHELLIDAIDAGDAAEAARISSSHLTAAQRWVCRSLKDHTIDAASARNRMRSRRR